MKLITLYVPAQYIDLLDELVDKDYFPNRSEAIRVAIRDLVFKYNSFEESRAKKSVDVSEEY